jgi:hypothetical protein
VLPLLSLQLSFQPRPVARAFQLLNKESSVKACIPEEEALLYLEMRSLPKLKLSIIKRVPYTIKCCFDFDFHTMMVILHFMDCFIVPDHKNVSLIKPSNLGTIKLEVVSNNISIHSNPRL